MIEYNKDKPLRVATAFSGYDSQKMALERLHRVFPGFCYELVAWSEIEKNAICAHNAVFPEDKTKNLGDISKVDWTKVPDFDLFTYSFPCQDISAAGNQKGFEEGSGTRSSLLWECKKAIEAKKPRFLMMENVKALASAKFLPFLRKWQSWLHRQGYENFTQILNATDYEVPQNRERVFMISILRTDDNPYPIFHFPRKMILEKRLKHVLEQNVDESYYLSQKMLEYFCRVNNDKSHCHNFSPKDENDIAFTVRCTSGQRVDDNFIKFTNTDSDGITGVADEVEPKIVGYSRDSKGKVVKRSLKDISNTVTTFTGGGHSTDMYVAEPKIAASRGRGASNRQQLEINGSGTSNTITSVNKDNLLMEPKINFVGQYDVSQNSRVIDTEGVSYCISNGHKDGMPKIIEPNVLRAERTEECKKLRKQNGDKGMKFNAGNKKYCIRTDGLANTLSTSTKDNMLAEPTLMAVNGCLIDEYGRAWRIRKLTPTECFRLMDVEDKDIEKMKQAGIAKTNLYKLAGNSIVVSCMFHLFRKLFVEKESESGQLELF